MDATEVQRLFRYDRWANREVVRALTLASPPSRTMRRIAHILGAEAQWLGRLQGHGAVLPIWPELSTSDIQAGLIDVGAACREYVSSLDEAALGGTCQYANTRGEQFVNAVSDILMHVVMHSAYHRGQIAADLRLAGLEPPVTDFIHAVRNGYLDNSETHTV